MLKQVQHDERSKISTDESSVILNFSGSWQVKLPDSRKKYNQHAAEAAHRHMKVRGDIMLSLSKNIFVDCSPRHCEEERRSNLLHYNN